MHSRVVRTSIAVLFAAVIAVSASAAPEGRSESGDWLFRGITRIVQQIKKILLPSPFDDSVPAPPKP